MVYSTHWCQRNDIFERPVRMDENQRLKLLILHGKYKKSKPSAGCSKYV